ncbi:hypothetical protein JB92DRAFT_2874115 [Gautieria morchelliformis]|nr:hypothetical protein JB92DRAFT_2874115 [Gautieria morchelliformis]
MAAFFSILFSARLSLFNVPRIMLTALTGALWRSVGYCISPESFTLPHGSTQFSKHQPILPTISGDVSPDVAAEMASAVSSSSPPQEGWPFELAVVSTCMALQIGSIQLWYV